MEGRGEVQVISPLEAMGIVKRGEEEEDILFVVFRSVWGLLSFVWLGWSGCGVARQSWKWRA